jgi:glycosyltransferase involved in cell wall biosynthesis
MKPLVSIVIPCYNSEAFLRETLESILEQTFQDWECLIINNGSTDKTVEIGEEYSVNDSRFKLITKIHGGISSGRNLGIKSVNGVFIQLLDSDDLITPDKIKKEVEFLIKNHSVDIVYSGARYFYSHDKTRKLHVFGDLGLTGTVEIDQSDLTALETIKHRNPFVTSAPLYRASVFQDLGLYDETLQYIEDWDFQIRCALAGKQFHYLGYKPNQSTLIRLHDSNISKNRIAVQNGKKMLFKKYPNLFPTATTTSRTSEIIKEFIPPVFLKIYKSFTK